MILPSRKLVLLSQLRPDEAANALRAAVSPRRSWRQKMFASGRGNFMGEVGTDSFALERDIAYRNSFLPQVTGTIGLGAPASRIDVSMKMHGATSAFLGVWLAFVFISFLMALPGWLQTSGHGDPQFLYITGGMTLFGIILPNAGFYFEAKKAEQFLMTVFQAERFDPNRAI